MTKHQSFSLLSFLSMSSSNCQLQTIDKETIQSPQINEEGAFCNKEESFNSCKDHFNIKSGNKSTEISDSKALNLLQTDQQTSLSPLYQSS